MQRYLHVAPFLITAAKVLSCETVKVRLRDNHQRGNPEVMQGTDIGLANKYFVQGLRLYLDGYFPDPPMPQMPAAAQNRPTERPVSDDDCCIIL